ncbi:MAG: 4-hydroxy-3-methylbut-2-enyl diphosphate reductase [bacterium]|nr:4-hydroxy-3-methylbut-2-enyl diphosphate reductase [bacterium]
MKIELAQHSGFCMGVRRAILSVVNELNTSEEDVYVYGPLIHNPQTLDVLKKRGLKTVTSLEDIDDKQIAIRTHGIPLKENREIKSRASRTINLTCSRVARVQATIKKYTRSGYFTIIAGDDDHAEVIGLKSFASSGVCVVSGYDDLEKIPSAEKYLLVAQTTLDREFFKEVEKKLVKKFRDILVIDTICDATNFRQDDVIQGIKKGADTLVVVGGKGSANTRRLAQIGTEHSAKTLHIETEQELRHEDFKGAKHVLVTAGASTPGWIINNVLEYLYNIQFKNSNILINIMKRFLEFIVRTNLLSAISAFFLNSIIQQFAGLETNYYYSTIAFLYIFSMYSINNFFERDLLKISNPYKYTIYEKFRVPLLVISLLSLAVSLLLSIITAENSTVPYPWLNTEILFFSYLFGFIYSTAPVKKLVSTSNIDIIKKLYNSKIVTAFGWLIIMILPLLYHSVAPLVVALISIFILTYILIRHILNDIIAFQGDLILGRATLATWIGINKIYVVSFVIALMAIGAFGAGFYFVRNSTLILFMINILFFAGILNHIRKRKYLIALKYELLVDVNYLFMILFYCFVSSRSW